MKVYQSIAQISGELSHEGISKDRSNAQQGYKFRGIDDCLNALAPLLSKHHLVILPEVLERDKAERETRQGGALFYVTVKVRYAFVNTEDGSRHDVTTYGEAMDSADKATNKAMSAAYKYAVIQTFCIPTEGDNDADAATVDVAGQSGLAKKAEARSANTARLAVLQQEGAPTPVSAAMRLPNFGHTHCKGKPVNDAAVTLDDLHEYLATAERTIADQTKSAFHSYNARLRDAIGAELVKREGVAAESSRSAPATSAPADTLTPTPDAAWKKWLLYVEGDDERGNVLADFKAAEEIDTLAVIKPANRQRFVDALITYAGERGVAIKGLS